MTFKENLNTRTQKKKKYNLICHLTLDRGLQIT